MDTTTQPPMVTLYDFQMLAAIKDPRRSRTHGTVADWDNAVRITVTAPNETTAISQATAILRTLQDSVWVFRLQSITPTRHVGRERD